MSTVAHALAEAAEVARSGPASVRSAPAELAARLYSLWYAAPVTERPTPVGPPLAGLLDARALTVGGWSAATVRRVDPAGGLVVRDADGRHHAVLPGRWTRRPGDPRTSLPPRAGDEILIPPVGGPVRAEGWWRTWSLTWVHPVPPEPLTRIYLCARLDSLGRAVGRAVEALAARPGPWLLKCALDPDTLTRPDRIVVYLPDEEAGAALEALASATDGLLDPQRPPLTAAVSPGLSWAQDDGDGASFGENRCAALADGYAAWLRDGQAQDAVLAGRRGLIAAGIDDLRPHLRRGSA